VKGGRAPGHVQLIVAGWHDRSGSTVTTGCAGPEGVAIVSSSEDEDNGEEDASVGSRDVLCALVLAMKEIAKHAGAVLASTGRVASPVVRSPR
jgi:hypothetical protein